MQNANALADISDRERATFIAMMAKAIDAMKRYTSARISRCGMFASMYSSEHTENPSRS